MRGGLIALFLTLLGVLIPTIPEMASQPPSRRLLFGELVVSGVAVNNVLPGRIGDLLRARWLGLDVSIPGGRALATVVVDRGFDLLALVTFLLVSLPFVTDEPWLDRIVVGGLLGLRCAGGAAALRTHLHAATQPRAAHAPAPPASRGAGHGRRARHDAHPAPRLSSRRC